MLSYEWGKAVEDFQKLLMEKLNIRNREMLRQLWDHSSVCSLKKGDIFIEQGVCQKDFAFLLEGGVKKHFVMQTGKVCIEDFVTHALFPVNELRLTDPQPSLVTVEAIMDTKILVIPPEVMMIAAEDNELVTFYHDLCNTMLTYMQEFKHVLEKPTAERYKWVIENRKDLLAWISQKELALYLNMTPERLSAIKKKYKS